MTKTTTSNVDKYIEFRKCLNFGNCHVSAKGNLMLNTILSEEKGVIALKDDVPDLILWLRKMYLDEDVKKDL